MKILIPAIVAILLSVSSAVSQKCVDEAKVVPPALSAYARKTYETKLEDARKQFEKTPNDADAIIWLGRRTAYLGYYKEAIGIFGDGIAKFPGDMRFLRHRGHRLITLRCFDEAIIDLRKAADVTFMKPDEIEPDGLPNARNTPTSTLQTNIWYHLGLAQYLKGDFNNSAAAFMACYNRAKNPDMQVAAANWAYVSGRRYGDEKSTKRFINADIRDGLDIIENTDYYNLVKLYQGKIKAESLMNQIGDKVRTVSSASLGYGLGNWYLYNGDKAKAMEIFRRITAGDQWASFGYIAAEAELKR